MNGWSIGARSLAQVFHLTVINLWPLFVVIVSEPVIKLLPKSVFAVIAGTNLHRLL